VSKGPRQKERGGLIGNPALTIARLAAGQFSDDILVLRIRCARSLVIAKDDVQNSPRHLAVTLFEESIIRYQFY
jgi:hypothetical protein